MPVRILMVCLGNICRSPIAEGVLESKLPADKFRVDSAGTGNYHTGKHPDHRSIAIARSHGVDISKQKARQFSVNDFAEYDYIYVMDQTNYRDVIRLAPDQASENKVSLFLDALFPGENVDVPDPYFGLENGFVSVYSMIDEACEIIAQKLLKNEQ